MPFEKKDKIEICCKWCGKTIEVRPWRKGKVKFCSKKCKYSYLKKSMLIKNASKKKLRYRLICKNIYCCKSFIVVFSKVKKRKYCSRKCYYISKTQEYKKEVLKRMEVKKKQDEVKNILSLNKRDDN